MYLFQNNGAGSNGPYYAAGESKWASRADPRARSVMVLLSVLVLSLHALALIWLARPKPVKPKPAVIEVSLLSPPAPTAAGPSAPPPSPAKITPPKKVNVAKPQVKAAPKKPRPKPQKPAELPAPVEKTADHGLAKLVEEARSTHFETFQPQADTAKTGKTAPPNAAASAPKPAGKNTVVERATCVSCPDPEYPAVARRRGLQGSVLLKFELTPDGLVRNITVVRSSGHQQLDQAAKDNAKESRFTQGEPGVIRLATKQFNFTLH